MDKSCTKFTERLSAYLDGQLSPEEMAETAAHIEQCHACAALLDKMRRLDEMGAGVEVEFDEALMGELDARIMAGLDETEESHETGVETKARIFPIWYRYAAIAASVVIVFFVGRMAFMDSGADLQRHQIQSAPVRISPAIPEQMDTPSEATDSDKDGLQLEMQEEPVVQEMESKEKSGQDQAAPDKRGSAESGAIPKPVSTSPLIRMPTPVADEVDEAVSTTSLTGDNFVSEDLGIESPAIPAASKITGRITDQETGQPLAGATVQVEGTTTGAVTDKNGEFEIASMPSDTYDLVCSSVGYQTKKIISVPATPKNEARAEVQMEPMTLAVNKSISVDKAQAETEVVSDALLSVSKKGSEAPTLTVDSLEVLYSSYTSSDLGRMFALDGKKGATDARSKSLIRADKYQNLLDSVTSVPEKSKIYRRLETLYIQARCNYDLYRQTQEKRHLDQATAYKNVLMEIIEEQLENDEHNRVLLDYKAEIERWRF